MRKLFIGLGIFICLLIGAAWFLPGLVPASVYKDTIQTQVSAALGRDVTIGGDVKLSILPVIRANAQNVTIANAEGFSDRPLAQMSSLQAKIKLIPLLKKQVEITQFTLVDATISLEKNKAGLVNWVFGDSEQVEQAPQPTEANQPFARDGRYDDMQVTLGTFSLKNGNIHYIDDQTGTKHDLEDVNMRLSMPGMDKVLSAKGNLVFNKIATDIDINLDTPKAFLDGKRAPFSAAIKSELMSISAKGEFTASHIITFTADVDADIPSVAKLDDLLGISNPYSALTETAKLKGKLSFDGTDLRGENTIVSLASDILRNDFTGDFVAGAQPSASGDLKVNITDVKALTDLLGLSSAQTALIDTVKLSTTLTSDGQVTHAQNIDATLKGKLIDAGYKGSADFDKALSLNGSFNTEITSVATLVKALDLKDIKGVELVENIAAQGNVTGGLDALSLSQITFTSSSADLTTSYKGAVTTGKTIKLDGLFSAKSPAIAPMAAKAGFADIAGLNTLGNLDVSGKISGSSNALNISNLDFKTQGTGLNASYQGSISTGKGLALNGNFAATSPNIAALVASSGFKDITGINALGDLDVSGTVSGTPGALTANDLNFKTTSDTLTASYVGTINVGETTSLKGRFSASGASLKALSAQAGFAFPYADAMKKFALSGNLNGTKEALNIQDLQATLSEGILNLTFSGSAVTGKNLSYTGQLVTNVRSIRELAALGGTTLPANTDKGQIYGGFSLSGMAKGSAKNINFSNANMVFDDTIGAGKFNIDLTAKPNITGDMTLQGLDLRPYQAAMYAQNTTGKIQPWSEEPLNLSFLNLFDGRFVLTTPNILMSSLSLGESELTSVISNGVLTTKIPKVSLYGGQGKLDMTLDARNPVTKVALDFTLEDMDGKGFLAAAAGFTKLTGRTGTAMKIRGQGRSQAEIMRSLNGNGNFELAEGVVSGIDLEQFVTGLDSAFTQRALPAGIGSNFVTPYERLNGLFSIDNGVVTIGKFALNANTARAEGGGKLDIGNQSVDFSLRPRLVNGKGLAGFGIPIRLSGKFGSISAGLDTNLLGDIVAARAKAELQNQLTDKVGGDLGGVLGSILGTPPSSLTPPATTPTPASNGQQQPAPTQAQQPKDPLADLLGGLLGTDPEPQPATPPANVQQPEGPKKEEPKKKEVDPLEKALNDLFGGD
jgi:AsmA protein